MEKVMWSAIKPIFETLGAEFRGRPNLRQVYAPIIADDPKPGVNGEIFEPGKSYFSVRLVELRLATAGRYLTEFLPMCTCVLSFQQAGDKRTIPFIAGVEMIRNLVGANAPADVAKRIALANLAVANNVPVPGGDVTMYLSFCRFKDSSLVRGLLELAAKTATAVAGTVAGPMVKTATDFAGGLMNVFSADGVETRFGRLDGQAVGRSGYRLLAGSADASLEPKDLRIQDGQLLRRTDGKNTSIDDVDYLVLAFEYRSTLKDENFSLVEALPFHAHWNAAADKIARSGGAPEAADADMMELRSAVLLSPQLTEADRLPLLLVYDAKREQLEAQFKSKQKKAGDAVPLLDALHRRVEIERDAGGDLAPLLGAASAAISEVIAAPRPFATDKSPDGKEMAATFEEILQGQRGHIATATPEQLAATARAYAVAAARR
jgi:hypothetical protein